MKIYLNNIKVWLNGLTEFADISDFIDNKIALPLEYTLPKPQYYPKAQLRRLSPFSKVILECLDMQEALTDNLPLVFASQHGDLDKTVKLIKNTAQSEELSPTHFALSVHNSTTGLFGIATKNKAATTTISAGKNSFTEGLVEASMQAKQDSTDVLYVYCDFPVPEEYSQFEQSSPALCIAMVISATLQDRKPLCSITIEQNCTKQNTINTTRDSTELCLDFINAYYKQFKGPLISYKISTNNYTFELAKA